MWGKRCSLCGGRLENNRCVECGLDNTQNDEKYKKRINRNVCDDQPLTHVHVEKKPRVHNNMANRGQINRRSSYSQQTIKTAVGRQQKKQKSGVFKLLYILFLIGMLGFTLWSVFENLNYGGMYEAIPEEENSFEDQNPYQYVTHELSEYGENYAIVLEPGIYQVGVHIPEGTYTAEPEEGYEEYINLRDDANGIYYFIDFGDYGNAVWVQDDIRMYDGAVLEVPMRMKVRIWSENAQIEAMHGIENPITDEVILTGNAVSGEDFEPGVYDIVFEPSDDENEIYGSVICTPSIEDMDNGIEQRILSFDEYWGAETYHNVLLPRGTTVVMEEIGEIKLFPVGRISDADYERCYNK